MTIITLRALHVQLLTLVWNMRVVVGPLSFCLCGGAIIMLVLCSVLLLHGNYHIDNPQSICTGELTNHKVVIIHNTIHQFLGHSGIVTNLTLWSYS